MFRYNLSSSYVPESVAGTRNITNNRIRQDSSSPGKDHGKNRQ